MSELGYRLLFNIAELCGSWFLGASSKCIAFCYFLFSKNRKESTRFYRALFPHKNKLYHLWCTFRQYQNFTTIHLDRFFATKQRNITFTSNGWDRLERVIGEEGGILLMSHLGNWEMAATLLKKQRDDLQLLLYMGVKEKEGVERAQKDDLRSSGVQIIGVDQESNTPFSAVEGIRFLQTGGLVSMTGDIVWREDQRCITVDFLGQKAFIPEAPFVFALVSNSPLFAFFVHRKGKHSYHLSLSEPISVQVEYRSERSAAIAKAAQNYANLLEDAVRKYPFQWYHFNRFIHPAHGKNSLDLEASGE